MSGSKSKHPLGRNAAESATLMFMTRLAHLFYMHGNDLFSGHDVAEAIMGAWQSYELSKDTPEIEAFVRQYLPNAAVAGEREADAGSTQTEGRLPGMSIDSGQTL